MLSTVTYTHEYALNYGEKRHKNDDGKEAHEVSRGVSGELACVLIGHEVAPFDLLDLLAVAVAAVVDAFELPLDHLLGELPLMLLSLCIGRLT